METQGRLSLPHKGPWKHCKTLVGPLWQSPRATPGQSSVHCGHEEMKVQDKDYCLAPGSLTGAQLTTVPHFLAQAPTREATRLPEGDVGQAAQPGNDDTA